MSSGKYDPGSEAHKRNPNRIHMKDALTNTIMKLVHSRLGGVVQWVLGAAIGWLISLLAAQGIDIPPQAVAEFQAACIAFFTLAIQTVVQWYQHKQAVKVQATLFSNPAHQDGWIGPVTVKRAEELN